MEFDVVIVGAGPAGLAAACRLGQLSAGSGSGCSICVVEKGSEVGAHIISGALFETRPLDELFPDWRERDTPVTLGVSRDRFSWLLNGRRSLPVPTWLMPATLHNRGNFIISLGKLCIWLAARAEELDCTIIPGFAATELLYGDQGQLIGVATGDMGIDKHGVPKEGAQCGYELRAKYVLFGEGCRGNLVRDLESQFDLRRSADPQHYGLGLKEIWEIDPRKHRAGEALHTVGWPLDNSTAGGGFLYHAEDNQLYLGLVVALSYRNPYMSPFDEFQRWKMHPRIRPLLEGGRRIAFGARTVNKGGLQSLPKLTVPGGLLIGCDAGFLNDAKVKGSHTAMKSGMLAAEAVFEALLAGDRGGKDLEDYSDRVRQSWLFDELHRTRNFSPGIARFGVLLGGALAFFEQSILRGRSPLTLHNRRTDHGSLLPSTEVEPIPYPVPDGVVCFNKLSSVFLSSTHHEEDQPCHLKLADPALPIAQNLARFDEPAQRYCPAAVYEIVDVSSAPRLQINAANCLHCKACEIKDPARNISWRPPEGGGGPNYAGM